MALELGGTRYEKIVFSGVDGFGFDVGVGDGDDCLPMNGTPLPGLKETST